MTEREVYHEVARALGRCPEGSHPELGRLIDHFLALESRAATEEYRDANKIRAMAYKKVQNDARDLKLAGRAA